MSTKFLARMHGGQLLIRRLRAQFMLALKVKQIIQFPDSDPLPPKELSFTSFHHFINRSNLNSKSKSNLNSQVQSIK